MKEIIYYLISAHRSSVCCAVKLYYSKTAMSNVGERVHIKKIVSLLE